MQTKNPQDIAEGQTVAFLTNLTIHYVVTRVWSTGKVELHPVGRPLSIVPAHARELVQV